MNYIALHLNYTPAENWISDLLAEDLADIGYEMFESTDDSLTAYINVNNFKESDSRSIIENNSFIQKYNLSFEEIVGQDWNSEWEKNYFKPIIIGNECVVHSSFHTDIPAAKYDIVIDPKMAFGTGHHSTTMLMMKYILQADLKGKRVIDMGTGTGILALLSKMRGADTVIGIEIDPDAHKNAIENAALNNTSIELINGDADSLKDINNADFFYANINRNIILEDIEKYANKILKGGTLLLSGFYLEDVNKLMEKAHPLGFELEEAAVDNNWAAIRLKKITY